MIMFSTVLTAQHCDAELVGDLFANSRKLYDSRASYKIYTSYELHEGDSIVGPVVGGLVLKKGDLRYSKMQSTEQFQDSDKTLTISHVEKLVQYREGIKLTMHSAFDVVALLPYFDSYDVEITKEGYACSFVPLALSGLPFDELQITLRKDYSLQSQEVIAKAESKAKQSRMLFCFSALEELGVEDRLPNMEAYIVRKGGKVVLTNKLKNYQLID